MSFITFLIGTLLFSSIALALLLVAPRTTQRLDAQRHPIVGAAIAGILIAIGFIGGLSIAG